jgi:pilus assembly protein CpaF
VPIATKKPAQPAPVDKEKKRKERLGEIKLELHKRCSTT